MPDMITTAEELDAIPSGWVVRSADGSIACRFDRYRGVAFGDERPFRWSALSLPVQVIWRPDVDLVRLAGAEALRDAADEMDAVIMDGNVAEVAAPVQGEVGRSAAIAKRDELYEEPSEWVREYADRLEKEARG